MTTNKPTRLIDQPSAAPTRKVQASVLSGAMVTLAVFILSKFGISIPSDVITAGAVVLVSAIAAYQTKNEVAK